MSTENRQDMPAACECCGFRGIPLQPYSSVGTERWLHGNHNDFWFCEICANTSLSDAVQFPRQVDARLYRSLGWLANRILHEIRQQKKEQTQ